MREREKVVREYIKYRREEVSDRELMIESHNKRERESERVS